MGKEFKKSRPAYCDSKTGKDGGIKYGYSKCKLFHLKKWFYLALYFKRHSIYPDDFCSCCYNRDSPWLHSGTGKKLLQFVGNKNFPHFGNHIQRNIPQHTTFIMGVHLPCFLSNTGAFFKKNARLNFRRNKTFI